MKEMHKEDIISLVIFGLIALVVPTLIICRHFYGMDPAGFIPLGRSRILLGWISTILAFMICLYNFYTTIYVPWSYHRKHGSMDGFAHTSGLPMLGVIFVIGSAVMMPVSINLGIALLVLYLIDGNGLPYLFLTFLREGV